MNADDGNSAFVWLDEGIQWLLPGRVYDLRDVGFNALAAGAGLGAAALGMKLIR